eukprot:TRINITY_DN1282_c0_g1_i1.p1 TRINITY_DN1282_c0_g1~~TRINITY_DN1282_c0_g1_i1.p1  ORF type:complete len:440 (+),score=93.81 TRINITY_DN1282_c0_g1_i1:14-1333(+)
MFRALSRVSRFVPRLRSLPIRFFAAASASPKPEEIAAKFAGAKSTQPPPKPPVVDTPLTETIRDFLPPDEFYNLLKTNGMNFYTGVPDSLLADFCAYVTDHTPKTNNIIAPNEGLAMSIATGYHLATRKYPVIYMQNSGFGNTVNPLLSMVDSKIYSIPMLLLIGWRGEPGKKDEPQHLVQGKVMSSLLTDLGIQFEVLPDFIEGATDAVEQAVHYMERRSAPYAFLVKRQTFTKYKLTNKPVNPYTMTREDAMKIVTDHTKNWDIVVSTTGFLSRELYEYRDKKQQDHRKDFLTVGAMGHASSIAAGIAMSKPSRNVFCLDGDGAGLMHMGSFAMIGSSKLENYRHILFNNGCHDSVGGQPTLGFQVHWTDVAKACGYKQVFTVETAQQLAETMNKIHDTVGPVLVEVKIKTGTRSNLGRPKIPPIQNKKDFMHFLDG